MATAMAPASRCRPLAGGLRPLQRLSKPGLRTRSSRQISVRPQALLHGIDGHTIHAAADALSSSAHGALNALYSLADAAPDGAADAAAAAATAAGAAAAAAAKKDDGGAFGWLANGFEATLEAIDGALEAAHVPYSYGYAIILLTIMVKLATYPLSQKSMQSTMAMQALQPRVKELQLRYANEPETLQLETARLYREAGVNPLAGCLPTLATIPVFIGLYRALTQAADDGLLTSGFYWIPSLGGPTTLAMREEGSGLSWLFPFVDGAPPIGWHDAAAYLVLPVLLVVSQYASQKIVSPQSNDPAQQQTQAILKFIPFMIGWFSLNVPSGLTLYWLVNNIISTGQQVYMKRTIKVDAPAPAAAGAVIDVAGTPILPPEERGAKAATGRELGARKKKGGGAAEAVAAEVLPPAGGAASSGGGPRRGSKFAARKAKEAASKAAMAGGSGSGSSSGGSSSGAPAATAEAEAPRAPDAPPLK